MSYQVLIVDDSFLMRSTLKKILAGDSRITGIEEAQDGEVAMKMVKEKHYDLILLDIEMPIMDGIEFMKRSKLHTDAHIVIVSSLARVNSPQVETAVSLGAFDVVAKPTGILSLGMEQLKHDELLDIVNRSIDMLEEHK
jgi:two-component system, chemotaxis family, protein-glutamate methylesterase/glutaminase